jgi:hypothetical protein
MKDQALWDRLQAEAFLLSDPQETLAALLPRRTGLTPEQARVAVQEYRRLLYLAIVSNDAVGAGPVLDDVWKWHSKDRGYAGFCDRVLKMRIYPPAQARNYGDDLAYSRTLVLYAQTFGAANPRIWPEPETVQLRWPVGFTIMAAFAGMIWAYVSGWFVLAALCATVALGVGIWWQSRRPWPMSVGDGSGGSGGWFDGGGDTSGDGGGGGD